MILNHLGFIQCPSRERCYFKDTCIDVQVARVLAAKAIRSVFLATCMVLEFKDHILFIVMLCMKYLHVALPMCFQSFLFVNPTALCQIIVAKYNSRIDRQT